MKFFLSQAPFVRITIPLILGIILTLIFNNFSVLIIAVTVILLLVTLLLNIILNKQINIKDRVFNIFIFVIFVLLGYTLTTYKASKFQKYNQTGVFIVQAIESPHIKNNNIKFTAKLIAKKDSTKFTSLNKQKVILFIKADSNNTVPNYGDYLIIKSKIKAIEPPKNPGQFNYKKYLFNKGILNSAFVKQKNCKVHRNNSFSIYKLSNNIRNFLLSKLNNFAFNNNNKAIISAISLGLRSDIDEFTNEKFANVGVMHILAVSGLHVGIVFLILILFFKPILKYKYGKPISYLSIIILLWIYALITGLTPSVVRAVLMFSLVALGNAFNKKHNIYNTIFASVFILLVIDPYYIFHVGFQLSYLAVIGIIFFQPKIASLIKSNSWLFNYFWGIISVSIAAQFSTLPLTLLYFHKFPVYFLLSNIAVMLNVVIILSLSIIFFATFYIPYVNEFVAKILDYSTSSLNFSVEKINNLPHPIIDNISWNINYTIISYSIILLFAFYLLYRNKYIFSLIIILVFSLSFLINQAFYKSFINKEINFFSVNKHTIIGFTKNRNTTLLVDKNYTTLKNDIKFNILNYVTNSGSTIQKTELINVNKKDKNIYRRNNFIKFENKTLFVYNGEKILDTLNRINLDYLIIQKYNYWNFDNVLTKFNPKNVVLSSSLWANNITMLDSVFKEKNITVINLSNRAFITKLNSACTETLQN